MIYLIYTTHLNKWFDCPKSDTWLYRASEMSESHQQLLLSLKTVVEGLLSSQVANVWNIYGGLTRLHRVVERILKHEYTVFKPNGEEDCWVFIKCLDEVEVLNSQFSDPAMAWLQHCLENHTLSGKLSSLLLNEEALNACYGERAFLRHQEYSDAALVCLRALELNQLALLTDIHPSLYLSVRNIKPDERLHRRCSSYPESVKSEDRENNFSSKEHKVISKQTNSRCFSVVKRWRSLPCLSTHIRVAYSTQPSSPSTPRKNRQPLTASVLRIDYRPLSSMNIPRRHSTSPLMTSHDAAAATARSLLDGAPAVLPMSTGFFPRPSRGQSLASFLTSNQFNYTSAELDRENAHFSISEAIIAAIEQVKYNRWVKLREESIEESDEEICNLKQRIRVRRRLKQDEKRSHHKIPYCSDNNTSATDVSLSPMSESSSNCSSESPSTEGVDDIEVDQVTPTSIVDSNGLSISMASLYSESDLVKPTKNYPEKQSPFKNTERETKKEITISHPLMESLKEDVDGPFADDEKVVRDEALMSAEGVALSLLRRFSDKQLPRASEIDWLVSEKEAPQQLLPLPESWSVNCDDMVHATALRGTSQWAPPRPQIIFTIHSSAPRKVIMVKQKYMCAGCGMKVAPEYSHRFRYCDYLGRYFCTGCHSNQTSLIPARILFKWDFNRYPVSNFSYRLLEQMSRDPLFNIGDVNSLLYKKVRALAKIKNLRFQLFYIKDFLLNCRFCTDLKEKLENEPNYLLSEPELYSIEDLSSIRCGTLNTRLAGLMSQALNHISKCQLCEARGFVCEICRLREIIYPWQLNKVVRCDKCGTCHHQACYKNECPRCTRISLRITKISL